MKEKRKSKLHVLYKKNVKTIKKFWNLPFYVEFFLPHLMLKVITDDKDFHVIAFHTNLEMIPYIANK